MNLFMYTGNGFPGPLDSGLPNGGSNVIEGGVEQLTILFHQRLQALGIPSVYDDYGTGHALLALLGARSAVVDRPDHGRLQASAAGPEQRDV